MADGQISAIKIEIEFMGIKKERKIIVKNITHPDEIGQNVEQMIDSICIELGLRGLDISSQAVAFLMSATVKETIL